MRARPLPAPGLVGHAGAERTGGDGQIRSPTAAEPASPLRNPLPASCGTCRGTSQEVSAVSAGEDASDVRFGTFSDVLMATARRAFADQGEPENEAARGAAFLAGKGVTAGTGSHGGVGPVTGRVITVGWDFLRDG